MNLIVEKIKRDKFLLEVYKAAKDNFPISPSSVYLKLSRYKKYNFQTKEFINEDDEIEGYDIGEKIGLSKDEVDSYVFYFASSELEYLSSGLGMHGFSITQKGILYLENLEMNFMESIQFNNGNINIGNNSIAQIQLNSSNSQQALTNTITNENLREFLELMKSDLVKISDETAEDLNLEIENAIKHLDKGKNIKSRLLTIASLVKEIGIHLFVNLISSPIAHTILPQLGIII